MGMPAQLDRYYTRADVLAMPDDGHRHELVHGELLVSPSPRVPHQRVLRRLLVPLSAYCERTGAGEVLSSPAELSWGREDILAQPDLFVIGPRQAGTNDWDALRDFPLFVEILSPATTRYDRFTKRRLYQEMRVPLYWIVDIANRRVEEWTPDATVAQYVTGTLSWHPAGVQEPFEIALDALFAP